MESHWKKAQKQHKCSSIRSSIKNLMKRENGRQFSSTFKVKEKRRTEWEKKVRVCGALSVKHRALRTPIRICVEKIACIYLWLVYSCKSTLNENTNCERKKVDKASSVVLLPPLVLVLVLLLMSLIILLAGDVTLLFSHFAWVTS